MDVEKEKNDFVLINIRVCFEEIINLSCFVHRSTCG